MAGVPGTGHPPVPWYVQGVVLRCKLTVARYTAMHEYSGISKRS